MIEKIRVSSGYEGDTQALWTIEKVTGPYQHGVVDVIDVCTEKTQDS